jgi:hypothetical protein
MFGGRNHSLYLGKEMNKVPLIGLSIVAVVLFVLSSLTNVVGYQTVQSSNQKVIKDEVNQKDVLFQTILDITYNKEIQKILLTSEMKSDKKLFFAFYTKSSPLTPPVLTKKLLNAAYNMGVILSKVDSPSKMHSILDQFQVSNQEVENEITTVIEKDATLNGEITHLSNLKCDCGNENTTR